MISFRARYLLLSFLTIWVGSCVAQQQILVKGGTLIDGNGGSPMENASILIEGDRIKEVRSGAMNTTGVSQVIDATGKFIIPGLQDAHVHYRDWMPPLYINNGITTIHDIGNSPADWIIAQREMLQKEKIVGPRLYASILNLWGRPKSDGTPLAPGFISFTTLDEAKKWAEKAVQLKADYIKIHEGFTGEMLVAVAQVAKANNLAIVGHVPPALNAFQAAERGQNFLEHSTGVGRAITKNIEELHALEAEWDKSFAGRPEDTHEYVFIDFYTVDPVKQEQLIQVLVNKNIFLEAEWASPARNITSRKKDWAYEDLVFLSKPELSFIPKSERFTWMDYSGWESLSDSLKGKLIQGFENWQKFMVKFTAAGGKVVTGTAAPNAIPGLGVHRDMQLLVDAGIPPMKAIQAATKNVAEMTRKDADIGTVEAGRYADMLVLDANPLDDITNTQKIVHVIKGGKIIERKYFANFKNPLPTTELEAQTNNNNPRPSLSAMEPNFASVGDSTLTVRLRGKGFAVGSVVRVNGRPVETSFKSRELLEILVPKELLAHVGTYTVQVSNPEPLPPGVNPGESNKIMFLVKF